MKPQIATSREQSERLLKCGIDPKTADMVWTTFDNDGEKSTKLDVMDEYAYEFSSLHPIPAWSLSALLMLLPKQLEDFPFAYWYEPFGEGEIEEKENPSELNGEVKLYFSEDKWIVDYDWDGFSGTLPQSEHPIEAVIQAIELLHVNGYEFNEIKP